MIRGTSLAILALLALVVLATGTVSAAPRQQAMDDATLSSLTLSDVTLTPDFRLRHVELHWCCGVHRYGNDGNGNAHQSQRRRGRHVSGRYDLSGVNWAAQCLLTVEQTTTASS